MVKKGLILTVILSFFCIESLQASNVSYLYDSQGRLVEVLYENIGKTEYNYDASGNRLSQKVTHPTGCTGTLDGNLVLFIPYLSSVDPTSGSLSLWAYFVYEYKPIYPTMILFKYISAGMIANPPYLCSASTLSHDLNIHIPDILLPDGSTHLWVDLEFDPALSTDGYFYFYVKDYGVVSNL